MVQVVWKPCAMAHCQICNKTLRNVMFNYRQECRECRDARKRLRREGVSLRAIKAYLKTTGLKLEPMTVDVVKTEDRSDGTVVEFRTKPSNGSKSG